MTDDLSPGNSDNRHQRTRANRREAGMVSVLLHLPPALAGRIDQERGTRPRPEVILEWITTHVGLEPEAARPVLRRGRPRKLAAPAVQTTQVPAASEPVPVEPISFRLADWEALLKRVPDPRQAADKVPKERQCWLKKDVDGLIRIKWVFRSNDPRLKAIRKLGGEYSHDGWSLPPEKLADFIRQYDLVDLQPSLEIEPCFQGWSIQVVECGSGANALLEARLDFKAALAAASDAAAVARGLAMWLERRRGNQFRWYQVKAGSRELTPGTLISEPLREAELSEALAIGLSGTLPAIHREKAPREKLEAWATVDLQGQQTIDGLVRPEPHTGCPGHRIGSLLAPCLEAEDGSEVLVPRSEWDAAVVRAGHFGVSTRLRPKPPSKLLHAFNPSEVPGWATSARGGHCLFAYQQKAVRFALDQELRCLIADEMGLGKTASAIAAVHAGAVQRTLVVCPVNAIGVWQREISSWSHAKGPEPEVAIIRATDEVPALSGLEWVIIGYETLAGRDERLEVNDEKLKNALRAFFTKSYGHASDKAGGRWTVKDGAPWLSNAEPAPNPPGRRKRWCFTAQPDLEASYRMRTHLDASQNGWIDDKLRARLRRMATRLGRPVTTALEAWNPELIVVDEAHRVKEAFSRRTRAVRHVCTNRQVLLLTGTPLRNQAEEGRALLEIISPARVWQHVKRGTPQVKKLVKEVLSCRMIRRLKKDVLTELPPKLRQRIPVRIEAENLQAYAGTMQAAEEAFAEAWSRTNSWSDARQAAMGLWSMARRELGVAKVSTGEPGAFIAEVVEAKGGVIVFAHHREVLDGLEEQLRKAKLKVGRIDGRMNSAERSKVVQRFQAKELQVFLGSTHAAGESITLTRAETVIFVELDWVPGVLLQAEDRGHRAGQQATSYHIIHLVAELVPPAVPPVPEGLEPLVPLVELLPEDYRRYEATGIRSRALDTAIAVAERDYPQWQEYNAAVEEAERLASVENIDEHMIDALTSKVEHIDEVLGETSEPVIGERGEEAGLQRLVTATKKRVLLRQKDGN